MATFDTVREIPLSLPGVEGNLARDGGVSSPRQVPGETLALRIGMDEREVLMRADPEVFFISDHYAGYPAVLIRLSAIPRGAFEDVLEQAWASVAPAKLRRR